MSTGIAHTWVSNAGKVYCDVCKQIPSPNAGSINDCSGVPVGIPYSGHYFGPNGGDSFCAQCGAPNNPTAGIGACTGAPSSATPNPSAGPKLHVWQPSMLAPSTEECADCGLSAVVGGLIHKLSICAAPTAVAPKSTIGERLDYRWSTKTLKCDCGSASMGVKDYAIGHSSWCEVAAK